MIGYLPSLPYGFSYARIVSFQKDKALEIKKKKSVGGIEFTYLLFLQEGDERAELRAISNLWSHTFGLPPSYQLACYVYSTNEPMCISRPLIFIFVKKLASFILSVLG